jgi:serine/threonine protein kinase
MTKLHAISARRQRREVTIDDSRSTLRGGEGTIRSISREPGLVAKIYHSAKLGSVQQHEKLVAMLDRPPRNQAVKIGDKDLPMFAWPLEVLEDSRGSLQGFAMHRIPIESAMTLESYMSHSVATRRLAPNDRSLPVRLRVCRNLAAVVDELHQQGHYLVDVKPANILLYKHFGVVCLVDNDSFSIKGSAGKRYPATAFSPGYRSPEILGAGVGPESVVNDWQDRFAISVLMFQVLGYGLHPFQGIPVGHHDSWNDEYCVEHGYYPYGEVQHQATRPSRGSTVDCWEPSLRRMFDRVFQAERPSARPTASEWVMFFDALLARDDAVEPCQRNPSDVTHLRFAGMACAECRLAGSDSVQVPVPVRPSGFTHSTLPPPITSPSTPVAPPSKPPAPGGKGGRLLLMAAGLAAIGFLSRPYWAAGDHGPPLSDAFPVVSSTSAAAPQPTSAPPVVVAAPTPAPAPPELPASAVEPADPFVLSSASDTEAIERRVQALRGGLVEEAAKLGLPAIIEVMKLGLAGDDAATLEAEQSRAATAPVGLRPVFWNDFRKAARDLNEAQLTTFRADLATSLRGQWNAFALRPSDREIAGNLAYYSALAGASEEALRLSAYALTLPTKSSTGRSQDWQQLGAMYARTGLMDNGRAAYFVALAISTNLKGFCQSLLQQGREFGPEVQRAVVDVFRRIEDRHQAETDPACGSPPNFQLTP